MIGDIFLDIFYRIQDWILTLFDVDILDFFFFSVIFLLLIVVITSVVFFLAKKNRGKERKTEIKDILEIIFHDIKSPLSSIYTALDVIYSHPAISEDLRKYIDIVKKNTEKLNYLISYWAESEEEMISKWEDIDYSEFSKDIKEMFSDEEKIKKVRINIETKNLNFKADKIKLVHIINNLIQNSIKYGSKNIEMKVSEGVLFTVKDDGPGIPQDIADKVFEKGFTTKEGGKGLGLYIVKKFVGDMGGRVWIEQTKKGTTISFIIPQEKFKEEKTEEKEEKREIKEEEKLKKEKIKDREEETKNDEERRKEDSEIKKIENEDKSKLKEREEKREIKEEGKREKEEREEEKKEKKVEISEFDKRRILVVDDDEDIIELMKDIIGGEGYEVLVAKNGFEGFNLAKNHKPFLIFLDILMPGLSGLDIIERIRKDEEIKSIPIVIISSVFAKKKAEKLGADIFIPKPFSKDEILDVIKKFT